MLNLLKKIPFIKRFIRKHNPDLKYLIEKIGMHLNDQSIVIDVGANMGQTIDLFLSINSGINIYAFEPTKELINLLSNRYKGINNVHIYPIAI